MTDIQSLSQNQNIVLRCRSCGVVKYKNKFLVCRHRTLDRFALPGGQIELNEDSLTAFKREIFEETGITTKHERLFCVSEHFFKGADVKKDFHEIAFYYIAKPVTAPEIFNEKQITENDKGEIVTHIFRWVTRKQMRSVEFLPHDVTRLILKRKTKRLRHIISNCQ